MFQQRSMGFGGRPMTPMVRVLVYANVAIYVLQVFADQAAPGLIPAWLGLGSEAFQRGWYWNFLTYQFLHHDPLHLVMNMLSLYMMGPSLEQTIGSRPFLLLYLTGGILAGAGWLALTYPAVGICVGASGSIFAVLAAFATLFPRLPMTLLIFFVVPLTLQAWVVVGGLSLFQLMMLMQQEQGQVAYSAHLAGAIAGFAWVIALYRRSALMLTLRRWRYRLTGRF